MYKKPKERYLLGSPEGGGGGGHLRNFGVIPFIKLQNDA